MKDEVIWEEFLDNYSFENDNVHISAMICMGDKGIDPIVLCKNKDIKGRHTNKFPGTGFNARYLATKHLTNILEKELESFGFVEKKHKDLIINYKHQDEYNVKSFQDRFEKNEYLLFFKKALIAKVLQKTGLLINLDEYPIYIDVDLNEINPDFKAYRLFFVVRSFEESPNEKKVYTVNKLNVKLLYADDYIKIVKHIERRLTPKVSLSKKLLSTCHIPLAVFLKRS